MSSVYQSLYSTKHQFYSCLNNLTKPNIAIEQSHGTLDQPTRSSRVMRGVIYKIFHFLFGKCDDPVTINKTKQNIPILKEPTSTTRRDKRVIWINKSRKSGDCWKLEVIETTGSWFDTVKY